MRVFKLLRSASGFNWAGLPLVCGWLGVDDTEGLMQRLEVLVTYQKGT